MNEQIKSAFGILLLIGYFFWCVISSHRLLANRTSKPKITFKTGLKAAIAIMACTLFWKWSIGFSWNEALIYALVVSIGIGVIMIVDYLFYCRDK
jgi:fucose permease